MGNSPLVPLTADAESVVEPGKQCVLSDAITFADFDAIANETLEAVKYMVGPYAERVLKEVQVEEIGPDEFSSKVILDGKKLTAVGYGNKDDPNLDRVASYNIFKLDRAERKLTNWNYGDGQGFWANEFDKYKDTPALIATTFYLKDPLRVEYHWLTTDKPPTGLEANTRYSNDMVKGVFSPILEGIASKFANLKVKITLDAPSVYTPGEKSVVSNTLNGDEVSFEALFDGFVAVIKESNTFPVTIEDVSDTVFKKTSKEPESVQTFTCDKEKGTITAEMTPKGGNSETEHFVLNKSPLQFEGWRINEAGERKTGKATAKQWEKVWNLAYQKATTSSSWFSW